MRLALQQSLLGEIYPNIRAIVFSYKEEGRQFKLRYYLDSEPTEDDQDHVMDVSAMVTSHFWSYIDDVECECIYSLAPIRELDVLDGLVFLRAG